MFADLIARTESMCFPTPAARLDGPAHDRFMAICRALFADPAAIGRFVAEYAGSVGSGGHRSGKSFVHENGFTKVSMWKFANGCQMRLHVYPEPAFVNSTIHSHRWNLSSYVMRGVLTAYNYVPVYRADGRDEVYRVYDEVAGKKAKELAGRADLTLSASYTVTGGGGHFVDYKVPHKVSKPAGQSTITLMLSGPAQSDHSLVSWQDTATAETGQRRFLAPAALPEIVEAALAHSG